MDADREPEAERKYEAGKQETGNGQETHVGGDGAGLSEDNGEVEEGCGEEQTSRAHQGVGALGPLPEAPADHHPAGHAQDARHARDDAEVQAGGGDGGGRGGAGAPESDRERVSLSRKKYKTHKYGKPTVQDIIQDMRKYKQNIKKIYTTSWCNISWIKLTEHPSGVWVCLIRVTAFLTFQSCSWWSHRGASRP